VTRRVAKDVPNCNLLSFQLSNLFKNVPWLTSIKMSPFFLNPFGGLFGLIAGSGRS
jgi:hypothetical protein